MWLVMQALGAPCSTDVEQDLAALEKALDEVEAPLREVLPSLAPERPPRAFARDDGTWLGLGFERVDCTLPDGTGVLLAPGEKPLPGFGIADVDRFGASDLLVIGTHDEARDGWDRLGYLSIVAHEWVHVHHAALDPNASAYSGQHKLEKQFLKDPDLQEAALGLAGAALSPGEDPCDLGAVKQGYRALLDEVKPKLRTTAERWMFTEGIARYVEALVEARLRGRTEGEQLVKSCTSIDEGRFGYAVGCTVARALQRCQPSIWKDGMQGPFGRHLQ